MLTRLKQFFVTKVIDPAALFRLALGTTLLADAIHLYANLSLFPTVSHRRALALGLWILVLAAFASGLRPRLLAPANYLFVVALFGTLPPYNQVAADRLTISLSLLAVVLAFRPRVRWVLPLFVGLVYFNAAGFKLLSPMWRAGWGVVGPAGLPSIVWNNTSLMALLPAELLRLAGWVVIAFELFFLPLYFWRRTRTFAFVAGVAFHVGIAVVYPFPFFQGLMLAAYAGFIPAGWLRKAEEFPGKLRRREVYAVAAWIALALLPLAAHFSYRVRLCWERVEPYVFRFSGVGNYDVFGDWQFKDYRYQLRLRNEGETIPYGENGLYRWQFHDRLWEDWFKRTQSPWMPTREAEANLAKWARWRWGVVGEAVIEARPQRVSLYDGDAKLFGENSSRPWEAVGRIDLRTGAVFWVRPSDEKTFGPHVERLLSPQ